MKKFSLITAVLLLSCAWAVAQTSPSSADQSSSQPSTQSPSSTSPSSTSPSSQTPSTTSPSSTSPTSQQPETSATSGKGNAIEGCLGGSAGNFTLTDASGTTYQLAGDTSKLSDHVGQQVQIWGDAASSASSSATGSTTTSSASQTFNVKRVKMVSSSCANK